MSCSSSGASVFLFYNLFKYNAQLHKYIFIDKPNWKVQLDQFFHGSIMHEPLLSSVRVRWLLGRIKHLFSEFFLANLWVYLWQICDFFSQTCMFNLKIFPPPPGKYFFIFLYMALIRRRTKAMFDLEAKCLENDLPVDQFLLPHCFLWFS